MRKVFSYASSATGADAFAKLKHDNEREFPEYVEEMRGLAEGAGVKLDEVWCANLLNELNNLMAERANGCSDLFAVAWGGYGQGFAEGHNEDWNEAVKPFMYFLSYRFVPGGASATAEPGPPFSDCAGLAYPAHILGSPPAWNAHGLYATEQHLSPRRSRRGGLALAFIKRRAVCEVRGIDSFLAALTVPGWSTGTSVNVVDMGARRMANVELYEDRCSILEVTEAMGNYSHFNEYRRLRAISGDPIDDPESFVHDPRQALVDSLPPSRLAGDIEARLSDAKVFSTESTVATLVLNASTGILSVWCCGHPATSGDAVYRWNLSDFAF